LSGWFRKSWADDGYMKESPFRAKRRLKGMVQYGRPYFWGWCLSEEHSLFSRRYLISRK
jgi:hypothetical protein